MIYRVTQENLHTVDEETPKWFLTVRYCGYSLAEARIAWHREAQDVSERKRLRFEQLDDDSLPPDQMGEFELVTSLGGPEK